MDTWLRNCQLTSAATILTIKCSASLDGAQPCSQQPLLASCLKSVYTSRRHTKSGALCGAHVDSRHFAQSFCLRSDCLQCARHGCQAPLSMRTVGSLLVALLLCPSASQLPISGCPSSSPATQRHLHCQKRTIVHELCIHHRLPPPSNICIARKGPSCMNYAFIIVSRHPATSAMPERTVVRDQSIHNQEAALRWACAGSEVQ